MTSPATKWLSAPAWGAPYRKGSMRERPHLRPAGTLRPILAGGGRRLVRDLLAGVLLLAVWIALWSFFTLGVVQPAARLHGTGAEPPAPASARDA
jgi:hypothetical protein